MCTHFPVFSIFSVQPEQVNMHEAKAITVTEVIKIECPGNRSGARHCRAWIHLYITLHYI